MMNIKFRSLPYLAIIVFALNSSIVYSQDLSGASFVNREEGKFRTLLKKTGEVLWQASWTIDKNKEEEIIHMKEQGFGKYNGSKEDISWTMNSSFIAGNTPKVFSTTRTAYLNNKEIWKSTSYTGNIIGGIIGCYP